MVRMSCFVGLKIQNSKMFFSTVRYDKEKQQIFRFDLKPANVLKSHDEKIKTDAYLFYFNLRLWFDRLFRKINNLCCQNVFPLICESFSAVEHFKSSVHDLHFPGLNILCKNVFTLKTFLPLFQCFPFILFIYFRLLPIFISKTFRINRRVTWSHSEAGLVGERVSLTACPFTSLHRRHHHHHICHSTVSSLLLFLLSCCC